MPQSLSRGKKSIFARQIEAQRVKEGNVSLYDPETVQKNDSSMEMDQCHPADDRELASMNISSLYTKVALILSVFYLNSGPRLVTGQGLQGPGSTGETQRIHRENQAKLQGMSQSEILQEQKKLLSQLGGLFCLNSMLAYSFIDPFGTQLTH